MFTHPLQTVYNWDKSLNLGHLNVYTRFDPAASACSNKKPPRNIGGDGGASTSSKSEPQPDTLGLTREVVRRHRFRFFQFAAVGVGVYGFLVKTSIRFITSLAFPVAVLVFVGVAVSSAFADQVTLQNGDVLNGKVLSMTTNAFVLQDASLGRLTLPRAKVSNITFGVVASAAPPLVSSKLDSQANSLSDFRPTGVPGLQGQRSPEPADAGTPNTELQAIAREVREHSNLVEEVEAKVLGSSASPQAADKFNELLDQLSSGQLDMNGLRAQAQSAAGQLQEYKKEMGAEAGEEVDSYLSILNSFLRETAPTNGP